MSLHVSVVKIQNFQCRGHVFHPQSWKFCVPENWAFFLVGVKPIDSINPKYGRRTILL